MAGRRSRRRYGGWRGKSGSTRWVFAATDPLVTLVADGADGGQIAIPNATIGAMTEPTLVHAFVDVCGMIGVEASHAGILVIGGCVLPRSVTLTDAPFPVSDGDGDWFYHRTFPLNNSTPTSGAPTSGQFREHLEVKSARKIQEDEQVWFRWEWFHTQNDPTVEFQLAARMLLRQA